MKQKVSVEELRPGMYVAELDRPWQGTPYLLQGIELRTWQDIEDVRRFCRHVYIEVRDAPVELPSYFPERVLDTAAAAPEVVHLVAPPPPAATGVPAEPVRPTRYADSATLEQEIQHATEVERRARDLVTRMMHDARLGKALDFEGVGACVGEMVNSVIRNPDALVWFTQLKTKDEMSAFHSLRTSILALSLGRHLGYPKELLQTIGVGALLHDIGKMRVPNELLNKRGRLTPPEHEIVKTHVAHGVEILQQIQGMPPEAIEMVRQHHERYDGSGYPQGLMGEQISPLGMICAIADFYDSAVGDQSYNPDYSAHTVLNRMYDLRDLWFQSELVEQFIQSMSVYPIGSIVEFNDGRVGVVLTVNRTRRLRPRVALVLKPDKSLYDRPLHVDLVRQDSAPGPRLEISKVLAPSAYQINPVDYLP